MCRDLLEQIVPVIDFVAAVRQGSGTDSGLLTFPTVMRQAAKPK
jgi:hypothetical protein